MVQQVIRSNVSRGLTERVVFVALRVLGAEGNMGVSDLRRIGGRERREERRLHTPVHDVHKLVPRSHALARVENGDVARHRRSGRRQQLLESVFGGDHRSDRLDGKGGRGGRPRSERRARRVSLRSACQRVRSE